MGSSISLCNKCRRRHDSIYETSVLPARNDCHSPVSVNLTASNQVYNANSQISYIPSATVTNHLPSENNIFEPPLDLIDGAQTRSSHEISYNKISVREPLSKVLAERALMEHHYTEVDEEGTSCFYEEIAGSTNSSVTYTKIGDLTNYEALNPLSVGDQSKECNSMKEQPSTSRPFEAQHNSSPRLEDLYASVDKSCDRKKTNGTEVVKNIDELYAKVNKNGFHTESNKSVASNPARISVTENTYDNQPNQNQRMRSPQPTPPPPPLLTTMPSRSTRAISFYDDHSKSGSSNPSHNRRYSFSSVNFNPPHDDYAIEDPGYEIVLPLEHERKDNVQEPEADPGYEPIRMLDGNYCANNKINRYLPGFNDVNNDAVADPGYEIVLPLQDEIKHHIDESEADPGYEPIRIHDGNNCTNQIHNYLPGFNNVADDALADPGYEVVNFNEKESNDHCYEVLSKNYKLESVETSDDGYDRLKQETREVLKSFRSLKRNESDISVEPGYERVNCAPRNDSESGDDPAYATIKEPEADNIILIERL